MRGQTIIEAVDMYTFCDVNKPFKFSVSQTKWANYDIECQGYSISHLVILDRVSSLTY